MFKHQGDVPFYDVQKVKGKKLKHNGSFVLALGETTGHKHVITVERPDQMEVRQLENGQYILVLTAPGTVTHEEHHPITIDPGTYRVGREREKDWFSLAIRQVID